MTINKDQYKKTLRAHKDAIRECKLDIKRHKLLIKNAKTTMKIAKLSGAKVTKKTTKNNSNGRMGMSYEAI